MSCDSSASGYSPVLISCLEGLNAAMLARDPHTACHQERVAILARRLAVRYGLSAQHAERIRIAGRIHDVGKLTLPMTMLMAPRPLSTTETIVLRDHALFGAQMLRSIGAPEELCETVQSHHERLDGDGYPLGLSGREISIDARIVAVSDVVDAMLSDRPHRPARRIEDVVAVLERERGLAYDSDVVRCALEELEDLELQARREDLQLTGSVGI